MYFIIAKSWHRLFASVLVYKDKISILWLLFEISFAFIWVNIVYYNKIMKLIWESNTIIQYNTIVFCYKHFKNIYIVCIDKI